MNNNNLQGRCEENTNTLFILPIKSNVITEETKCLAMAFNKEATIMVSGTSLGINVFEFKNGQLRQVQLIGQWMIFSLYFMKHSNEFISGSQDSLIKIWGCNSIQFWQCIQQLEKGHSYCVSCVLMNRLENLMISCSYDKCIKLWQKKDKWECSQTLIDHTDFVLSLNLNDSENQLVSCGFDAIRIRKLDSNQRWRAIQKIRIGQSSRICFLGDNMITLQLLNVGKMEIFKLNDETKLFIKTKEVKVDKEIVFQQSFHFQFNNQLQILLNQHGRAVHLMRKQDEDNLVVEQTLTFEAAYIQALMTDDGEYLVTWDSSSCQFQVRKQYL